MTLSTIGPYDVHAVLRAAWFTPAIEPGRWGLPVLFTGLPGVGKTSEIKVTAAHLGLAAHTIIPAIRTPEDFGGVMFPVVTGSDRYVEALPLAWGRALATSGHAVGVIDEVNSATAATQAALHRVVLEGVVGDLHLPGSVRMVLIQNPVEIATAGADIATALANRCVHVAWPAPSEDAWTDFMVQRASGVQATSAAANPQDARALEQRVVEGWGAALARATGATTGFVRARRGLLHVMPGHQDPSASGAWPSPRTWHMATHALAGAEIHGLGHAERDALVAGCIGIPAYAEFLAWLRAADLPDPADLLDGRVTFQHVPERPDRTAAVLSSCAAFLGGPQVTGKERRAIAFARLLDGVRESGIDLCVRPLTAILLSGVQRDPEVHAALRESMRALGPMLRATGVMDKALGVST